MTTTYDKDGAYIEVTVDGVVYRRALKWEDCVVSVPGVGTEKIDMVYVNNSDQLVLVLEDESEITLAAVGDLTIHAALATGVHGAGASILATIANIATHAGLPTVHQNAPALIQTHAELPTAHQNAPALIITHANLPTVHQNAPALIAVHALLPTVHQNAPVLISEHAALPTVHQNAPQLIIAHAGQPTVHQNAPALIQTHAELPTVHQNATQLISTHAALTTGVHGAGSNYVAHFGQENQVVSKIVWLDASDYALALVGESASIDWTDVDLTTYTSANAKLAFVEFVIIVTAYTSGYAYMGLRKNDTTPTYIPLVYATNETVSRNRIYDNTWIGLDSGQVFEYTLGISGTMTVNIYIFILGYAE